MDECEPLLLGRVQQPRAPATRVKMGAMSSKVCPMPALPLNPKPLNPKPAAALCHMLYALCSMLYALCSHMPALPRPTACPIYLSQIQFRRGQHHDNMVPFHMLKRDPSSLTRGTRRQCPDFRVSPSFCQ